MGIFNVIPDHPGYKPGVLLIPYSERQVRGKTSLAL